MKYRVLTALVLFGIGGAALYPAAAQAGQYTCQQSGGYTYCQQSGGGY